LAVSAGDAYLDIGPRLASDFGRKLAGQVQAPIGKAGEEASKHFGRSFAHGVGTAAKGIGIGIAAGLGVAAVAARALAPVLKESVQGYRDHLKVVAQTTAAIKSTGGAAKVSVKDVTKLSDALERKTTVDGDVIQTSANMLLTFKDVRNEAGKGNDIFNQATATVLDMSVALGQDGKNSAIQLGKALNDPIKGVGALSRVGVTFTQQQKDQIKTLVDSGNKLGAQKIILKELNSEFGGSAAAQATASGRMQVAWHQLQDTIGSVLLPVVDRFENSLAKKLIPDLNVLATRYGPGITKTLLGWVDGFTRVLPSTRDLGLGVRALGLAFQGEGITTSSDKFVGKMERLGVTGRKVVDWARNFGPQLAGIGHSFTQLFQSSNKVGPALAQAGGGGQVFANTLTVAAPILDVVARNLHNMIPWLPAIVAGFLAFRAIRGVLGPVSDLGNAVRNFATPALVIATFAQARATKALAAAQREQVGSSLAAAGATEASTAAGNAGVLTAIRARAATIGQAVAQRAVAAASRAWAAVQWLVNAALTANPIGIVIVAIAALAAGIIYAYKHSETFRKIVDTAFKAIKGAVGSAVVFIIGMLRHWLDFQFDVVAGILHVMGKLPGPMGAPFRKAEEAVRGAKKTVDEQLDKVQQRVNKLTGKDIPVTASLKLNFSPTYTQKMWVADRQRAGRMAGGGMLHGPGTGTSDSIPLWGSKGEFMVNAVATSKWLPVLKFINADRKATGGPVGQIDTQSRAINKIEAFGTGTRLHAGIAAFLNAFGGTAAGFPGGAASGNVIRLALAQAKRMAASFKVALALIEAGIVESGLRNLNYGDRDSIGFLQQRPSQGWAHPMDISYASWDFLRRAIPIQGRYGTAGALAQAVQRSAFPGRYDAHQAQALGILHAYNYDRGGMLPPGRLAVNMTERPEALGFDYEQMAEANVRAMRAAGLGAVYLDSRRVDQGLSSAAVLNNRRR
jgi:hypothetical protein